MAQSKQFKDMNISKIEEELQRRNYQLEKLDTIEEEQGRNEKV